MLDKQKASPPPEPTRRKQTPDPLSYVRPSRQGARLIGGHFSPEVAKLFRILVAEEGTTGQALLEEALSDLFVKKGKKAIV
ncbi:hypothetical protein C2W62_03045 [Candidatus Entotheonella serta]|nr:hypothetical protein C2W62_03045 [Candidatus Entotheonella serta]